jgi:hypothetical protein
MANKFIIKEEEKSEILKKHTEFKKILEEELSNLNRGLVNEQFNTGVVKDPLLTAAERAKCISNGKQITWEGKPGYYKVATADREGRFSIGDKLVIYNDYTYEVYPKDGSKRKKFTWSCPQINQDTEAQAAAAKEAEAKKKAEEQAGLDSGQKEFIKMLTDQGYIIDPTPGQIASNRLKPVQLGTIPKLDVIFPKGLNVYYDPTKRSTSNVNAYKERAGKMVADVNTCKDIIQTYWDDYSGGGEGDLTDTQFLDTKNQAQACANKYYPKWDGLEGGVLGIGSGQNHLNNIIDVLTGKKTNYEGAKIPSAATGWPLIRPRTER